MNYIMALVAAPLLVVSAIRSWLGARDLATGQFRLSQQLRACYFTAMAAVLVLAGFGIYVDRVLISMIMLGIAGELISTLMQRRARTPK